MNTGKNRYYKFSKISEARFRRLLRAYAMDLTASDAARLTGISLRSVNAIYLKIRRRIAEYCEEQSPYSDQDELEVSEAEERVAKPSCSACSNVMAMSTQKLSLMPRKRRYYKWLEGE